MRWRIVSSLAVIGAAAFAVGLLHFGTGCRGCGAPCLETETLVLQTTGFVVVSSTSSCANASSPIAGSQVSAGALDKKTTCHFDVTLDDGEIISFDVPFTKDAQSCCCGSCVQVEVPDWSPLTLTAPPGYVPNLDAGADASED